MTIVLQAFQKDQCLKFAGRMNLGQETSLPEDTIHIWYQKWTACHPGSGRGTFLGQDTLDSLQP